MDCLGHDVAGGDHDRVIGLDVSDRSPVWSLADQLKRLRFAVDGQLYRRLVLSEGCFGAGDLLAIDAWVIRHDDVKQREDFWMLLPRPRSMRTVKDTV